MFVDVCSCDETKEVPLHWELLICTQFRRKRRVDLHEEQQL